MSLTTNPNDPCLIEGQKSEGQNECYLVLSEEERAKGFVRPVRTTYIHIGRKIEKKLNGSLNGRLIRIDDPEYDNRDGYYTKERGYAGYLEYSEEKFPLVGKYLTKVEFDAMSENKSHSGGCGVATTMNMALSETYARNPKFYGATFCVGCNKHLPVDEFVWDGTDELVGS
jgi:hypothetical protein